MIYAKTTTHCYKCTKSSCKDCLFDKHCKVLEFIECDGIIFAILLVGDRLEAVSINKLKNVKEVSETSQISPFKKPVPLAEDEDWISVWDDLNRPKEGKHYWVILESGAIFEAVYKDGYFVDIYSDYCEEIFNDVAGYKIRKED